MTITLHSERDGRVSVWTFSESFTAKELTDAFDDYQENVLSWAQKIVYMICDFTQVRHLPLISRALA